MSRKKRIRLNKEKEVEQPAATLSVPRNWIIGLILTITFLTFANTLTNGFAYDDKTFILQNEMLHKLSNIPQVLTKELWFYRVMQNKDPNKDAGPTTPYYRPAFSIFHMICWQLFQDKPGGWHVSNVLVHMLAVYFVFLIFERITKNQKLTVIATLLFAIHPLRVESVAWICGVSDPFLAIFLLPSFYLYLRYREEGELRLLIGALVTFLFASFTKEPAVALPIFIGAYELFVANQDKDLRARITLGIRYSAVFLLVSGFYFASRYYALGFALNNSNYKSYPTSQVLMTIPLVIWKYIGLLFWPVELSLFHATYMVKSPLELRFILPFLGLIGLGFGLWKLRGSMLARFALLWFFINLLPVLNLGAFGEDFLVQERYVYIPSIGFSLLAAMAIVRIPIERWLPIGNRRAAQIALVGVLVFVLAGKSLAQNTNWKDDMTVWITGADIAPEQSMSHYILGHKLIDQGEYVKAAAELEAFLKLVPGNLIVISNLASCYTLIYQYQAAVNPGTADRAPLDRALELCEQGLSVSNDMAPLWDTLGTVYTFDTGLKNYDRAISCFQRGLSYNPTNPLLFFHLGGTLIKKGDLDGGIVVLQKALQAGPDIVDAHKFIGYAYRTKGYFQAAIDELSIYLQRQPNAPDAARVSKDVEDLRTRVQNLTPQS